MTAHETQVSPPARLRVQALPAWRPTPAAWAVLATVVFLALVVWWVATDTRVPSWDPGAHIFRSLQYADAFRSGDLTEWFTSYQTPGYPPLVYLLGAFTALIFGEGVDRMTLADAFVFVPLLSLGLYQAGRVAFNARTGAFAVVFVLGSPLIIAQSHVFMLDLPQTAMTAMTIWLLIASRRFANGGFALAAGLCFGLGMLTKNIFSLMLLGLLAVMLLRGGWRSPKGILLFALGVGVTGLPWYLAHFQGLLDYALGGSVSGGSSVYGADPPRWSSADWQWYLWQAINVQYLLPLWLFGVAGVGWALARLRRRPWAPTDHTPELLGGLAVGMVLDVALTHNDVRYTMPLVIYAGLLGSAWFATSTRRWLRDGAGALLAVVAALNLFTITTGDGPDWTLHTGLGDQAVQYGGDFTVLSTTGWLVGPPSGGGDVQHEMEVARSQGARLVAIDRVGAGTSDYNATGLGILARFAGLEVAPDNDYAALGPRDLFLTSGQSAAQPCGQAADGTPIYYELGRDVQPVASADNLVCPSRSAQPYAAPGPPTVNAQAVALLRRELAAAKAQGADTAYFQETVPASGLFGGADRLRAMARAAGLGEPRDGLSSNTGADGITVMVAPPYALYREVACGPPLAGDNALILTRGPVQTLTITYARNLYCPTRSPELFTGPGGG
jgi:4-amino-4-deoxy-L-arabinose transferase-like glycosyltransferase